jgi:pimeloyl-ACP methyl ester carboxylesterase
VNNPKIDFGLEYRNVSFESARTDVDVQPILRGWHVPLTSTSVKHNLKIGIVSVHGGGRDRREFLSHLAYWNKNGFEALLYDSSDHGLSDGTGIGLGFGYREQFDCAGAVRFAKTQLGWDRVIVTGTSVGATAALLATSMEPLADAVIAENPFYDYEPFFVKIYLDILGRGSFGGREASRYGALVGVVKSLTNLIPLESYIDSVASFTRWWIGASGKDGPIQVIKTIAPRPLFLIHGKADEMIPTSHSTLLYETAGEPKQIWLPEQGRHADVHRFYPEEYERRVVEFIETHVISPTRVSEDQHIA